MCFSTLFDELIDNLTTKRLINNVTRLIRMKWHLSSFKYLNKVFVFAEWKLANIVECITLCVIICCKYFVQ